MKKQKQFEKRKIENKEQEYLDQLQRLQAEFDNYRKRIEKEKEEYCKFSNQELIIKLLDILDDFELALKHIEDDGVEMIYSKLYSLLEKEGLGKIKVNGEFNPEVHEALIIEEGKEDNKIIEELQRGYILNNKVIRPSKVKISKIKEDKKRDEFNKEILGGNENE